LWELLLVAFNPLQDFVEFTKKPHAQPRSLAFIAQGGCLDIERGLPLDDQSPCHPGIVE
jgi:hypothetical protein